MPTTLAPHLIAPDLAVHIARSLGYPAQLVEHAAGEQFAECDYSNAHDELDERPAVVTLYGTESTLDVCLACMQPALNGFHDDGNDPTRTKVEVSAVAPVVAPSAASWDAPVRLARIIDADGHEGTVTAYDSVFTGRRLRVKVDGEFDASTAHGRVALSALRDVLTAAIEAA